MPHRWRGHRSPEPPWMEVANALFATGFPPRPEGRGNDAFADYHSRFRGNDGYGLRGGRPSSHSRAFSPREGGGGIHAAVTEDECAVAGIEIPCTTATGSLAMAGFRTAGSLHGGRASGCRCQRHPSRALAVPPAASAGSACAVVLGRNLGYHCAPGSPRGRIRGGPRHPVGPVPTTRFEDWGIRKP